VKQHLYRILWSGFVMAIPAVGVVFTLLDPAELHVFGRPLELGRIGTYTVGFLFFWALCAASSAFTTYLGRDGR